jgi:hypothetical protein
LNIFAKKRYWPRNDYAELGERLDDYKFNLDNNMDISLIAIWSLNGWRNAWGNHVDEGGGYFINRQNAIKHFDKDRRAGSSWHITMYAGFLIKENNDTFLIYKMIDDEYNQYIKKFIGKKKINDMLIEILKNYDLNYYKLEDSNNPIFLNENNINSIGEMRSLN